MRLLQSGIPLSLLLDLVLGPESADLLEHEGSPANRGLVGRPKARRHRTGGTGGAV
jgi:hypothetical protein